MPFTATPYVEPIDLSRGALRMVAIVRGVVRIPGLRRLLLSPVLARPGYWFATAAAWVWGDILFGQFERRDGIRLYTRLLRRSFGRGGTTIGAIYLTCDNDGDAVLAHEKVHTEQWKKYGLCFVPLYIAAGADARGNRFEVEAGLERGGYC